MRAILGGKLRAALRWRNLGYGTYHNALPNENLAIFRYWRRWMRQVAVLIFWLLNDTSIVTLFLLYFWFSFVCFFWSGSDLYQVWQIRDFNNCLISVVSLSTNDVTIVKTEKLIQWHQLTFYEVKSIQKHLVLVAREVNQIHVKMVDNIRNRHKFRPWARHSKVYNIKSMVSAKYDK